MRRGNDIDRKIALLYLIGFIVWKKKYIDIFFYQSLTLYYEIFSIMKMENSAGANSKQDTWERYFCYLRIIEWN